MTKTNLLLEIKNDLLAGKRYPIVFLGDSITAAESVHPNWREIFEYVLKEKLTEMMSDPKDPFWWKIPQWQIRCLNSGFDGSTTRDWLELAENEVLSYQPQMVIVMGTRNDVDFHLSPKEHKENVKKLLAELVPRVPYVVFSNDPAANNEKSNRQYQQYLAALKTLFPKEGVTFINLFEKFLHFPLEKLYTFVSSGNEVIGLKSGDIDFAHPNQLGNAYIANVFLEGLFGISFDPEKYIADTLAGKMCPGY